MSVQRTIEVLKGEEKEEKVYTTVSNKKIEDGDTVLPDNFQTTENFPLKNRHGVMLLFQKIGPS